MSGVRVTGNPEGEHDVLGKGSGYVVTWSDPLYDASWKVGLPLHTLLIDIDDEIRFPNSNGKDRQAGD